MDAIASPPRRAANPDEGCVVVDIEAELAFWRWSYQSRPLSSARRFESYIPAIKTGCEAYLKHFGTPIAELDRILRDSYTLHNGDAAVPYDEAAGAIQAAWQRMHDIGPVSRKAPGVPRSERRGKRANGVPSPRAAAAREQRLGRTRD